jgi:hypothetical protein
MYPPTRATFDPKIPFLAQMPSPPSPLRALVYKLNSNPTRRQKVAMPVQIKTEPESETKKTTVSNSSSSSNQPSSLSAQPSLPTSNTTPNSAIASTASNTSHNNNQPALSQALANLFQSQLANPTPAPNDNTQTPFLDFENSKIEIHIHVHPILRPSFPTPVSLSQKLKRKRETAHSGEDLEADNMEREKERANQQLDIKREPGHDADSGRSKKKAKLSHGFGYSFGDRRFRVDASVEDVGVTTRSKKSGPRRPSMGNRR